MTPTPNQISISTHYEDVLTKDQAALSCADWSSFLPTEHFPRPLVEASAILYERASHGMPISTRHRTEFNNYSRLLTEASSSRRVVPPPIPFIKQWSTDLCSSAEPYFDIALRQLYAPVNHLFEHSDISVYHDENDYPILFRKRWNASTALALVGLQLEGSDLHIPAGSIVSVGPLDLDKITGTKNVMDFRRHTPNIVLRSIEFDPETDPIRPLRHSAWVYESMLDRALFATAGEGAVIMNESRLNMLTTRTLDDFRSTASQLLRYCFSEEQDVDFRRPLE